MRIEMLPARRGDALWIEYVTKAGVRRRLLIDCGVHETFGLLAERVRRLPPGRKGRFELIVVTHVDGDHIEGALPLLADKELDVRYEDVWFNGWRHLPRAGGARDPVEGEDLTRLLARGDRWNRAFGGDAVAIPDDGELPSIRLTGGLKLTLVAPGAAQLARLKPVWRREVERAGLVPGRGRKPAPPPDDRGVEPRGTAVPNIAKLAAAPFEEDDSEANGSSIVLLAEHGKQSALLCGDAWPSDVAAGIGRLLAERGQDKLPLTAFKLPHHGSRFNVDRALLDLVECRDFLFSSDGSKTSHPHMEAVARVLETHRRARLHFNYKTRFNQIWGRADVVDRYRHRARYGDGSLMVDLDKL